MNVDTTFSTKREILSGGFWLKTAVRGTTLLELYLGFSEETLVFIQKYGGHSHIVFREEMWHRLDEDQKTEALKHCFQLYGKADIDIQLLLDEVL